MKWILCLLVVSSLATVGCKMDEDDGAGDGGGTYPTEGATVSITCEDDPVDCGPDGETYHGTVQATVFDLCKYSRSDETLEVNFVGTEDAPDPQVIYVLLTGFTGGGTYTTATGESEVDLQGTGFSSSLTSNDSPEPCTIAATSNLADIEEPEGAGLLHVSLDVSCPTMNHGGGCEAPCDPFSFSLSAGACDVNP